MFQNGELGFDTKPQDTRIVVGMSGGVDSSATAALLVEVGYEVIGITLQLYDHGAAVGKKGACCAGRDIYDAKRVCEKLGISHYVLDYETRFKKSVMDDFADSYLRGETPIPCVKCNQTVKFRDLLDTARDLGAQALVTGHYAKRIMGPKGPELHKGDDPRRDQSYFLFTTTRAQLDFIRFPLANIDKTETRRHAARFGLEIAAKPDSQDICFVPSGNYVKVIEKLRPGALEKGDIVHVNGQILGQHDGIINYTVGQRKGLGVSAGEPLYVIRLDHTQHRVIVGPKEALGITEVILRDVNWLETDMPEVFEVKLRSTQPPSAARLVSQDTTKAVIRLESPEYGISPGQACVMYEGTKVLGGGWISSAS